MELGDIGRRTRSQHDRELLAVLAARAAIYNLYLNFRLTGVERCRTIIKKIAPALAMTAVM